MTAEVRPEIGFYHCTRTPAADAAVRLAAKAHERGLRLLLVAPADQLDALDRALWTFDDRSFLPHGRDDAANQPILLADGFEPANAPTALLSLGMGLPAAVLAGTLAPYQRVMNLFEEAAPSQAQARADWKALAGREGFARCYWQQTPKGWAKAG